ncbi:MAG: glucose-1-phosphate adenylyltransferase [Calditrichaeota bacterium]|nr:MAG: glucose-1-phosphate adenylyltransferase [Calditrichota bacterium]
MNNMTAVILGGGRGTRLDPLTRIRSKPAVPIGGKFRLIDIPMSNCLHAGVRDIFILTQFNTESLHRHIYDSYRFDNFTRGSIRILAAQQTADNNDWYQGTADAVRKNINFLKSSHEHIIILSGDHLYRMDYQAFLQYHIDTDADISIAVKPVYEQDATQFGILKTDNLGRINRFYEKPDDPKLLNELKVDRSLFSRFNIDPGDRRHVASMGIYIFKKDVLFELLKDNKKEDFGKEIIPDSLSTQKVFAYFFDGYWEDIGTIQAFFDAHMDFTTPVPKFNFYDEKYPFYTRPRYLPASKINQCQINHSVISEGSILLGSIIEQAVVGIRSYIDEGTFVQRSIIMGNARYEHIAQRQKNNEKHRPNLGIGKNCIIRNAIIDMDCRIGNNVQIINRDHQREAEGDFFSIKDGIIIIPKGTIIPDNTII